MPDLPPPQREPRPPNPRQAGAPHRAPAQPRPIGARPPRAEGLHSRDRMPRRPSARPRMAVRRQQAAPDIRRLGRPRTARANPAAPATDRGLAGCLPAASRKRRWPCRSAVRPPAHRRRRPPVTGGAWSSTTSQGKHRSKRKEKKGEGVAGWLVSPQYILSHNRLGQAGHFNYTGPNGYRPRRRCGP